MCWIVVFGMLLEGTYEVEGILINLVRESERSYEFQGTPISFFCGIIVKAGR